MERPGTPWQRRPCVGTWLRTCVDSIRRPRAMIRSVAPRARPRTLRTNALFVVAQGFAPPFLVVYPLLMLTVPAVVILCGLLTAGFILALRWAAPMDNSPEARALRRQLAGHAMFPIIIALAGAWLTLSLGAAIGLYLHSVVGGPMPGGLGYDWQVALVIDVTVVALWVVLGAGIVWFGWLWWLSRGVMWNAGERDQESRRPG